MPDKRRDPIPAVLCPTCKGRRTTRHQARCEGHPGNEHYRHPFHWELKPCVDCGGTGYQAAQVALPLTTTLNDREYQAKGQAWIREAHTRVGAGKASE